MIAGCCFISVSKEEEQFPVFSRLQRGSTYFICVIGWLSYMAQSRGEKKTFPTSDEGIVMCRLALLSTAVTLYHLCSPDLKAKVETTVA